MTKEEILNYVMDTPENTNRAVLSDMLDELQASSGGSIQTIKPIIGEFILDSSSKGHCSFTVTGLKYNSMYILDFDFARDVAPLIPSEDWHGSSDSRVYFFYPTPVWYTWNDDYGAWMVSMVNSEEYASNDYMSSEEGETFTANIAFQREV